MHDLIPLGPALPGTLTTAEIDATMAYAEAEKSLATRAAYASDWRDFAAWCASRGATALPAHVGIVAAYLSGLADQRPQGQHHRPAGRRHRLPPQDRRPRAADRQRGREGGAARHPPDHRHGQAGQGAGDRGR